MRPTRALGAFLVLASFLGGCGPVKTTLPAPREKPAREVAPAPVLSPDLSKEEEARLLRQARAGIDGAERLVRTVDEATLPREQADTYATIQSFLAMAKEALDRKDLQRAVTLADKAQTLADGLVNRRR